MFKTANVGSLDRIIRFVVGLILVAGPFVTHAAFWTVPTVQWISVAAGVILIVTALVRFCPIYRVIGASTCKAS